MVFFDAFRVVGGNGLKVAIEVGLMATDGGYLRPGEQICTVGGTGTGADTAIVLKAAFSQSLFSKEPAERPEVCEILAMPMAKKVSSTRAWNSGGSLGDRVAPFRPRRRTTSRRPHQVRFQSLASGFGRDGLCQHHRLVSGITPISSSSGSGRPSRAWAPASPGCGSPGGLCGGHAGRIQWCGADARGGRSRAAGVYGAVGPVAAAEPARTANVRGQLSRKCIGADVRFQFGALPEDEGAPPEGEGWHRVRSPSARLGYLAAGLFGLTFPGVLVAWFSAVSILVASSARTEANLDTATPWGTVVWTLLLYIPLHEWLHAVWHPRWGFSPQTVMVIWPARLRFGVYYEGCMSRRRWLLMRATPLALLSLVPVGLLTAFYWVRVPFPLLVCLQVLALVNGIGSGGDVVAMALVLCQVPAAAMLCFRSGRAYWR